VPFCKISLKPVADSAYRAEYRDTDYRKLFGSLKVSPELPFGRKEFIQTSIKYTKGMSISGIQQKLSVKVDSNFELKPVIEHGDYILKPTPDAFPYASENEHAAMVISRQLGLDTALCGLVSFSDGELVYITRRFDRLPGGQKLHQEDMAQGLETESSGKYGKSYEETGRLIDTMTHGRKAVVLEFVRRVIFSYLIGNDDYHLKNISLQRLAGNRSRYYDRMTPNYDALFTHAFGNMDKSNVLALDLLIEEADGVFTKSHEHFGYYTAGDFLELANRLDIPATPVKTFLDKIRSSETSIINTIEHSYMPKEAKNRASELVAERIQALSAYVS
jgi:serine/threonine-protein kinase HipA